MLVLIAIPLVNFMVTIASDARENQVIRSTITSHLTELNSDASLVSFDKRTIEGDLSIVATVRTPRDLQYEESVAMQHELAINLNRTVALDLLIIPITRLEPFVPPTQTPTPPPGATSTPTPGATETLVPTATATPTIVPTVPPTSTTTPTVAPTPTATPSPTSTVIPSPTAAPTATPVLYYAVGATDGEGVNVRREPRLDAQRITALRDGVVVQLTGRNAEADGFVWLEVVTPSGLVGWIADSFLIPVSDV